MAAETFGTDISSEASFNTQPPEGGCRRWILSDNRQKSFNTQPPEGGCRFRHLEANSSISFNTQPPEGGCLSLSTKLKDEVEFQHTATRRWLPSRLSEDSCSIKFQHTATRRWLQAPFGALLIRLHSFNTQPPEGGCTNWIQRGQIKSVSTHSHPKVAASSIYVINMFRNKFQHTATRRWLRRL